MDDLAINTLGITRSPYYGYKMIIIAIPTGKIKCTKVKMFLGVNKNAGDAGCQLSTISHHERVVTDSWWIGDATYLQSN